MFLFSHFRFSNADLMFSASGFRVKDIHKEWFELFYNNDDGEKLNGNDVTRKLNGLEYLKISSSNLTGLISRCFEKHSVTKLL